MPEKGQLVKVKLQAATFAGETHEEGCPEKAIRLTWVCDSGYTHAVVVPASLATIVEVVPLDWPPQPGDVWAGRDPVPHDVDLVSFYFFYVDPVSATLNVRDQRGGFIDGRGTEEPAAYLLRRYQGKLELRHRVPADE